MSGVTVPALAKAERESGMTLAEAQAYTAERLGRWSKNVPATIPKEMRALRVMQAALADQPSPPAGEGYAVEAVLHRRFPNADAQTVIAVGREILAALRPAPSPVREAESLTYAVQHNPNCPSPYLVRLPRGVIDFAPPHQTSDALGYGKTFAEAFTAARAALAQDGEAGK